MKRLMMLLTIAGICCATAGTSMGRERLPQIDRILENCVTIVRGCQLPDGSLTQANLGTSPTSPVWIAPYFSNYAAMALLANHRRDPAAGDLARVRNWLEWCAEYQEPEGYWFDYVGTRAEYESNGLVDAWDSSAALYLLVLSRYEAENGVVSMPMIDAAKRALDCIHTVTDPADGLTWATPTYKVKFFLDNIEVYGGLIASAQFFAAVDLENEAAEAAAQAQLIAVGLQRYWIPSQQLFGWAMHPNGQIDGGLDELYPHGLAQLFGVAFVDAKTPAWKAVTAKFNPESNPYTGAGVERYAMAATRMRYIDKVIWHVKLVKEAETFTAQNVYAFRPGLIVLYLLEGADWMPNLVSRGR